MEVIQLDLELLRAEEVANALRIGRTKAYEMMAAGELPVVRLGCVFRAIRAGVPLNPGGPWSEVASATDAWAVTP